MESVNCKIEGRVVQHRANAETKSDGLYTYLIDREGGTHRLYREGELEFNDPFFDEFVDHDVVVEGELIRGEWLRVVSIDKNKGEL
ncbi:MAG: hypothetical protein R3Y68_07760 [Rikenellaceae bacterium]